jgi:hypothetical protein
MTSDDRSIRPSARWLAIALNIVLAAYCVFLLASIGTARATFLAVVCASYPLVVWWEARTLRGRNSEAADRLLIAATGVQLVLMTFASYAADLAKLGAGCPPQ